MEFFKTKVLLPKRMFDEAYDKEHFKLMLDEYMKTCYPNYIVKKIENGFALCERKDY